MTPHAARNAWLAMVTRRAGLAMVGVVLLAATAPASAGPPPDNNWHFSLTPYLWVPGFDGDFKFTAPAGGGVPGIHAGPSDVLAKLQFAFMGTFEARKGNWSLFTDFIYLDISGNRGAVRDITGPAGQIEIPINVATKTGLEGMLWSFGGAYSVYRGRNLNFDMVLAARYLALNASVGWSFAGPLALLPQSGRLKQDAQLWDAILGFKGRLWFGPSSNWFGDYYMDVGTGQSDVTWQAQVGLGYSFGWSDLSLSYRHLYYNPGGRTRLIENLTLYGPSLGWKFRF